MYNPKAGNQTFPLDDVVNVLEKRAAEVLHQNTKTVGYHKILKNKCDFIVIAGGDGTVGKIVKRIIDRPIPVAILPFGSANNVANSLNINKAISKIFSSWENKDFSSFRLGSADLGKTRKLFLESVGWGLFAEVLSEKKNRKSEKKGTDKVEKGIKRMIKKVDELKPSHFEVFLDGLDYSGNYLWIEIMNTHLMGPQLSIAPEASTDDDYLDIILVKESEREKLDLFLEKQQEKEDQPIFNSLKAKKIEIGSQEPIHVDSDIYRAKKLKLKSGERLEVSLHPNFLEIINSN